MELPTDDLQLAFWTIESLLEHDCLDVDALARKFGISRVHGVGRRMERFLSQHGKGVPWPEAFVKYARAIEGEATSYMPGTGRFQGSYAGPLWKFVEERLDAGAESHPDLLAGEADWSSGSFLLETVPCVLLALMRHAHDPEEAIVRAVNDTVDNDTIASIVGAAVGALHGGEALPRRWKAGLSGRVRSSDNGSVQKLIDESTERWV